MSESVSTWTFEAVGGVFGFTEGPVWDGRGVLFVDMRASRILRYEPVSGGRPIRRTDQRSERLDG